jgi:hypothetical protein
MLRKASRRLRLFIENVFFEALDTPYHAYCVTGVSAIPINANKSAALTERTHFG